MAEPIRTKMLEGCLSPLFKQRNAVFCGELAQLVKPLRVGPPMQSDIWHHSIPAAKKPRDVLSMKYADESGLEDSSECCF